MELKPKYTGPNDTGRLRFATRLLIGILLAACTLAPLIRIAYILITTGDANPSNDDFVLTPILGEWLDGTLSWKNFLVACFQNGHFLFWPFLFHILFASFFHWNIPLILLTSLILGIPKLLLLFDAMTAFTRKATRWILLPILALLFFSTSQISVFEFEFAAVNQALKHIGIGLGIWGLTRYAGNWRGILWMVMGGLLASWSSGSGPVLWVVFLLGLILLGYRKWSHYLTWLGFGLLSSLPYFYFLFFKPPPNYVYYKPEFFKFSTLIEGIGLSLSPSFLDPANNYLRGCFGLLLAGLVLVLLLLQGLRGSWRRVLQAAAPSLMLLGYGLLSLIQISVFRSSLAPWYTSLSIAFWAGLVGLGYVLFDFAWERRSLSLLGFPLLLGILLYFYGTSNLRYREFSFFLQSRSPVSASCLRHLDTAPTYCEDKLFLWGVGHYDYTALLGMPLKKHELSIFSPKQRWSLQGDFVLDTVRVEEVPGFPEVFWTADSTSLAVPYSDYRRLNLFLHPPNAVEWTVSLPANLKTAEFKSAVVISSSAPQESQSDGVFFQVSLHRPGEPSKVLWMRPVEASQTQWVPVAVSLLPFAGQTITLRLTSNGKENLTHDWVVLQFPHIDLQLDSTKSEPFAMGPIHPVNTDLSPHFSQPGPKDLRLNSAQLDESLSLCLGDFSHFYVRTENPGAPFWGSIQVEFQFEPSTQGQRNFNIPLLSDGQRHVYTYPLKLLELAQGSRLVKLKTTVVPLVAGTSVTGISLSELGFLRREGASSCGKS